MSSLITYFGEALKSPMVILALGFAVVAASARHCSPWVTSSTDRRPTNSGVDWAE